MEQWKKIAILIMVWGISFLLSACGDAGSDRTESPLSLSEMAAAVVTGQSGLPTLYTVTKTDAVFSSYASVLLGESEGTVTDGVICYPEGTSACEIAILKLEGEAEAEAAETALQAYLKTRVDAFTGYVPEQAALAEKGRIVVRGTYAALFVCPDSALAEKTFLDCFAETASKIDPEPILTPAAENPDLQPSESGSETEPVVSGTYDHDAVLQAWKTQDTADLSEKNRNVLESCREIIGERITEDMTAYEKELAIHDWMIAWAEYDPAMVDTFPTGEPSPDNDNPFGFFTYRKAICLGYTETFQLLMDLLEIPCITVHGYRESDMEEHAWNMVQLEGEWYGVDVTWDDPTSSSEVSERRAHMYLNVTSQYLRETNHIWDPDTVPEATADAYHWANAA